MKKRMLASVALVAALLFSLASAQMDDPMPLEPLDVPQDAWVRFVQASPNGSLERWRLEAEETFVDAPAGEVLAYMEAGEYLTIQAGRYRLDALLSYGAAPAPTDAGQPEGEAEPASDEAQEGDAEDAEPADEAPQPAAPAPQIMDTAAEQVNVEGEFRFEAGRSYTILISGLPVPTTAEQAEEASGGGFWGWLRGLFGGGASGDALALRAQLLEDADSFLETPNGRLRLVHAAPGTDAIDLVPRDGGNPWQRGLSFGNASSFRELQESGGGLDLRITGSELVLFSLDRISASPNTSYTVILVGTPVEAVPLDVITLTTP